MTIILKNGREVEIKVYGKYEDDIQLESAVYVDTGEDVEDSVADDIMANHYSSMYDLWYQNWVCYAEYVLEDR